MASELNHPVGTADTTGNAGEKFEATDSGLYGGGGNGAVQRPCPGLDIIADDFYFGEFLAELDGDAANAAIADDGVGKAAKNRNVVFGVFQK